MSKGCQARIRGYLSKARSQLFSVKFDNRVLNINKPTKVDPSQAGSPYRSNGCVKELRRKEILSHVDLSKLSDECRKNEEYEESNDEKWDEIDAKTLNEYRGIGSDIVFKKIFYKFC